MNFMNYTKRTSSIGTLGIGTRKRVFVCRDVWIMNEITMNEFYYTYHIGTKIFDFKLNIIFYMISWQSHLVLPGQIIRRCGFRCGFIMSRNFWSLGEPCSQNQQNSPHPLKFFIVNYIKIEKNCLDIRKTN